VARVLAVRPKVRVFKLSRKRWTFKRDRNPQHVFLRRGSKAVGLMPKDFPAC
jgi:hypothetical protein